MAKKSKKEKQTIMKKATAYEKKVAERHRAKQVGGAGKEDYRRGSVKGEVKNRKTPVTKPELIKLAKKGVKEVSSKGGFTEPARTYRDTYRPKMKLFQQGKEIPKKLKNK